MTIARRLTLLGTLPPLAWLGSGLFNRFQFAQVEDRSRLVDDSLVQGGRSLEGQSDYLPGDQD